VSHRCIALPTAQRHQRGGEQKAKLSTCSRFLHTDLDMRRHTQGFVPPLVAKLLAYKVEFEEAYTRVCSPLVTEALNTTPTSTSTWSSPSPAASWNTSPGSTGCKRTHVNVRKVRHNKRMASLRADAPHGEKGVRLIPNGSLICNVTIA